MKIKISVGEIPKQGFIRFPDEEGFRIIVSTDKMWKRCVIVDFRVMYNKSISCHKRMAKYES